MTPPDPTRMVSVCSAACEMSSAVALAARFGVLWCSANHSRRYPNSSASRAECMEARMASRAAEPSEIETRSRIFNGTDNGGVRSEEHTSELQSRGHLVCRLLLE